MYEVLKKFGLQGNILNAITTLYSTPSAQVFTSGLLSKSYPITNGTRQGCPPLPSIFNLIVEPLAGAIWSNQGITGFKLGKLLTLLPFQWPDKGIPYLGIELTSSTSSLAMANFPPLISKIEKELQQMAKCEISWFSRLAAVKMNILPQILYLFRTLTVPVLTRFLLSLSRIFKSYIWAGKKARYPTHA